MGDEVLTPVYQTGLTADTLGRRFKISEHPRFKQICNSKTPVSFSEDCELPDPYDGMLLSHQGDLPVHACMGLPIWVDHQLLGILTLDSMEPGIFSKLPEQLTKLLS